MALDRDVMMYAIAVWTKSQRRARNGPDNEHLSARRETGGGYVEMRAIRRRQCAGMPQIHVELHRQYVLGFTPQVLDGKTHKLDVKVKRPGLNVRHGEVTLPRESRKPTDMRCVSTVCALVAALTAVTIVTLGAQQQTPPPPPTPTTAAGVSVPARARCRSTRPSRIPMAASRPTS